LIEGHTDAVGSEIDNLSFFRSARRSGRAGAHWAIRGAGREPDDPRVWWAIWKFQRADPSGL